MQVIDARDIDDALVKGVMLMHNDGVERMSRNGPVYEATTPVTTVYRNPEKRVCFLPERDANPFFHLFETLWMLGGRDDLRSLLLFNSGMSQYSDDGQLVRGSAYGARWRWWFAHDQIERAIESLAADPTTRRVVMTQWDPATDPVVVSRDIPCNLQSILYRRGHNNEYLDLTVTNRSNDIIYGAYGSNVVHFSLALEYIARAIGCESGRYYQVSNSYHAYQANDVWQKVSRRVRKDQFVLLEDYGAYGSGRVRSLPLFGGPEDRKYFDHDNELMLDWIKFQTSLGTLQLAQEFETSGVPESFETEFFREVMTPMLAGWLAWKTFKKVDISLEFMSKQISAHFSDVDWLIAGQEWLLRRKKK